MFADILPCCRPLEPSHWAGVCPPHNSDRSCCWLQECVASSHASLELVEAVLNCHTLQPAIHDIGQRHVSGPARWLLHASSGGPLLEYPSANAASALRCCAATRPRSLKSGPQLARPLLRLQPLGQERFEVAPKLGFRELVLGSRSAFSSR